jgi:hypothetical protein
MDVGLKGGFLDGESAFAPAGWLQNESGGVHEPLGSRQGKSNKQFVFRALSSAVRATDS